MKFSSSLSPTRVMVFGIPGSGKSTFSLKLSKFLGLPLHHLDRYYFTNNWITRDRDEFLNILKRLVDNECWIIDGNGIQSLEIRYSQADMVIYMAYPRLLCLWRIFKRLFCKDPNIQDRAPNCQERVSLGLIKYLWTFDQRVSHILPKLQALYPTILYYKITNKEELNNLWDTLNNEKFNG